MHMTYGNGYKTKTVSWLMVGAGQAFQFFCQEGVTVFSTHYFSSQEDYFYIKRQKRHEQKTTIEGKWQSSLRVEGETRGWDRGTEGMAEPGAGGEGGAEDES